MNRKKIVLAGNPNVGKSTVFNALTGLHQHTGNWSGKTVGAAEGILRRKGKEIKLIDLPGTYSLITDSAEEEVTRNYLCFEKFEGAVVVCDGCCLERNLIFALQVAQLVPNTLICVNMLDDARKKGIKIDIEAISKETGLPAIGISAGNFEGMDELEKAIFDLAEGKFKTDFVPVRYSKAIEHAIEILSPALEKFGFKGAFAPLRILEKEPGFLGEFEKKFGGTEKNKVLSTAIRKAEKLLSEEGINSDFSDKIAVCSAFRAEEIFISSVNFLKDEKNCRDRRIDSVLTGKHLGIPAMLILFGFIFWITVSGANYPSELLSEFFSKVGTAFEYFLEKNSAPPMLKSFLVDGIWNVLGWVVAVMLPPMAIFFPLFTFLEDIGYLPRVAFNLDRGFKASGACGKQALTMRLVYSRGFLHIILRRCFFLKYSAALYMRLSKEDGKKDSGSIGSQREILKNYCAEKGFEIFGEYIDEGFSGTNFERPAFKKMLRDMEEGKINLILTKDLSRLGRDYISAGQFTEIIFPSKGIRYIAVTDGYDSEDSPGDFIPFKNIVNEMYARDISRKIRSAFEARMKAGDFIGPFAPFGYRRSPENRHKLIIDRKTAEIVKRIFYESAEGKTPKKICREMDSEGIPTPLDFRNNLPKSRNWNSATVLKILHNPVYLGHLEQGKTSKISFKSKISVKIPTEKRFFSENAHEAIVDEETFIKANRRYRNSSF